MNIENFLTNLLVKECWKSVHIYQSYYQTSRGLVFLEHGVQPIKMKITSVSETIWKDSLAEAQTKNTFCGMRVGLSVPVPKFCKKYSFPTQNFTEIEQSAAELWPQTIFNMAAVRHLEFLNCTIFIFGHMTEFQICCRLPNFANNAYARPMPSCSVCVCLSRSWIVWKRINISSKIFHQRVAKPF